MNEGIFKALCEAHGLPPAVPEFHFHPTRKWRFDWAWEPQKLALEIEGGAFSGGRHTRGKGFLNDMLKYNEAVLLGWRIVRCCPSDVESGAVFELLRKALNQGERA